MHQPIPVLDFSYNMLPWRRRIRTCLSRIDLDKVDDPVFKSMNTAPIRQELDNDLDKALWIPNEAIAYSNIQNRISDYMSLLRHSASEVTRNHYHVKLTLLKLAMDEALAGIARRSHIPTWKHYMLELLTAKNRSYERIYFTAEDSNQAFDWLLQAVMSQEEEILDEFKWSVYRLYHHPYNNQSKGIDITREFWDYAYPLAEDPGNLF